MAYFRKRFFENQNCLMLDELSCDKCQAHFLTDFKGKSLKCPICGGALNGEGAIVLNHGTCRHTAKQDGHEYRP